MFIEDKRETKVSKLPLISVIVSGIGALILLIGFVVPYYKFPNQYYQPSYRLLTGTITYDSQTYPVVDLLGTIIFAFILGILIISIITLIRRKKKLQTSKFQNTLFMLFIIFYFMPLISWEYLTFASYLADRVTDTAYNVARSSLESPTYEYLQSFASGYYIFIIGFFVIRLDLIIFLKYLIISSISFVIILGLVMVIKQFNVTRFLFGMGLKKKRVEKEKTLEN